MIGHALGGQVAESMRDRIVLHAIGACKLVECPDELLRGGFVVHAQAMRGARVLFAIASTEDEIEHGQPVVGDEMLEQCVSLPRFAFGSFHLISDFLTGLVVGTGTSVELVVLLRLEDASSWEKEVVAKGDDAHIFGNHFQSQRASVV